MHKIDMSKAEKWYPKGKNSNVPRHINLSCPHEGCGKPTFSIPIQWSLIPNAACASIQCVGCEKRINFYMTHPPHNPTIGAFPEPGLYRHI